MYLYGKTVVLRALEAEDMEMLRATVNDPDIEHLVGGWSFPVSRSAQMKWYDNQIIDKNNVRYAIEITENNEFIGMISLTNIDWKNRTGMSAIKLKQDAPHGRGYGCDAEFTLLKYAFEELNLHRITANVLEYNIPSIKLHTKVGAKQEGIQREAIYKHGKYHDVILFGILKEDFYSAAKEAKWS